MDDQDGAFFIESEQQEVREIVTIEQANLISMKIMPEDEGKINLKMVQVPKPEPQFTYTPFRINAKSESSESEEGDQCFRFFSPFAEFYSKQQLVYQRFDNSQFNKINSVVYFSGAFIQRQVILDSAKQSAKSLTQILKQQFQINQFDLPQLDIDAESKTELLFDSDFQNGNLFAAFQISERQYDLVMQNDTNSCGNNQWFYFSVKNMIVGTQYTFNVVNFTKNDSLFNYGMTPVAYSQISSKRNNVGWQKVGRQIVYKKGKIPKENSRRFYYRLSFKMNWRYANDKVYIAHSYPYTYSMLLDKLQSITIKNRDIVTRITIGKTFSKKDIEALVISQKINKKKDLRKAIIVMARQHPGEAQGSFVCDGFMDALINKTKEGDFIRKNYIVYVIPMVNLDGVIFGHYRTNLAGKDLNRKWDSTQRQLNCPEVTSIKAFIADISKERQIRFILDFHGHSKKLNSFFYGNPYPERPEFVRIFPYICSKLSQAIQFYDCTFAAEEYKRKAARVFLSYNYKQIMVYTFQSSFYGYFNEGKKQEFTPKQYQKLGGTLFQALGIVLEQQDFKPEKIKQNIYTKCLQQLQVNQSLLQVGNKNQSGSQSKPEEGELAELPQTTLLSKKSATPSVKQIQSDKKTQKKRSSSRKNVRELKQFKQIIKPVRNLRFLEISRVNSVLPDKYQLGLQPIKKKEQNVTISRTQSAIMKINSNCQTDGKQLFEEYRLKEIQQSQYLSNSVKFQVPSSPKRYNSMIKNTVRRNNIIFKIDFAHQRSNSTTLQIKQKNQRLVNSYTQTIASFKRAKRSERIRSSQLFPNVQTPETEKRFIKTNQIKYETQKISMKRQAQFFLNGMVKKYLTDTGIKIKENPIRITQKPLSIKKKEIYRKL